MREASIERKQLFVQIIIARELAAVIDKLDEIAEGLKHMATDEQVADLQAAAVALKQTVQDESGAVQDKIAALDARIAELEAGQGDQPDPRVAEIIAGLKDTRNTIAGLVEGGAEPDAPADTGGTPA